ncbi:MAG: hypothetical protein HOI55_14675 [Candidatus Marinimicrobia bacterium]|nr:hypothetical protein [Candidatus Neomarinimicrobiota bacterium]
MNKKELGKLGESLDVAINHFSKLKDSDLLEAQKELGELELENHVLNHFVEIKLIRVVKGGYTLTDKGLMFRDFLNSFFKS